MSDIFGTSGDDVLVGGSGDDVVDGRDGFDTFRLSDDLQSVTWQFVAYHPIVPAGLVVYSPAGGADQLISVERLQTPLQSIDIDFAPPGALPGGTGGQNLAPRVAALDDGGYVLAWEAGTNAITVRGITAFSTHVQRFDAEGMPLGAGFMLPTEVGHRAPAVAALAEGGYVVASSTSLGISVQRFSAVASISEPTEQVIKGSGSMSAPEVLGLADGGYLVAWTAPDGSGGGIFAQRFDAAGEKVGAETRINTSGTTDSAIGSSHQSEPAMTKLADGGYVVTWTTSLNGLATNPFVEIREVYAQRFDSTGARIGEETLLAGNAVRQEVAGLPAGGYVLAWDDLEHVYVQRFDAAGTAVSTATRLNVTAPDGKAAAVAALPDGGYVVSWASSLGSWIQRFDAGGAPLTSEAATGFATDVAALTDGGYVVAVEEINPREPGPPTPTDVFARRFDANSVPETYLTLTGGPADDTLRMHTGMRVPVALHGEGGDDILAGGPWLADVLVGGTGNDVFEFRPLYNGLDIIRDWAAGDRIRVEGGAFSGSVTAGDGSSVGMGAVQVSTGTPLTVLSVGTDATPGPEVVIRLVGSFAAHTFSAAGGTIEWAGVSPLPAPAPPPAPPPPPAPAPAPLAPAPTVRNGTGADDLIDGTVGNDWISGGGGNDRLNGKGGTDTLDGGPGIDTTVVETALSGVSSYSWANGVLTATMAAGSITLVNTERVQLVDGLFALDTQSPEGHAWQAAALVHAAFGTAPERLELSRWTAQADRSLAIGDLAQAMLLHYAPGIGSAQLVSHLYRTITGAEPTAAVVQSFVDQIGQGRTFAAHADLLAFAAQHPLNTAGLAGFTGSIQQLDATWF